MKKVKVYVRRCSFCMGKCRDEGGARCAYCSGTGQRATTIDVEPSKVLETCDMLNGVVVFDPNEPIPALALAPRESDMRAEFHRQHEGRDLSQHRLRGTYLRPPIAALWNQHCRTVDWMAARMKNAVAKVTEDEAGAIAAAADLAEASGNPALAGVLRGILNESAERREPRRYKLMPIDPFPAMLDEIRLTPHFTDQALRARYAALLKAADGPIEKPAPQAKPKPAPVKPKTKTKRAAAKRSSAKAARPAQDDLFNTKKGK